MQNKKSQIEEQVIDTRSPQQKSWDKRRENKLKEVVDTRSPQQRGWDKRRENDLKKVDVNVAVVKKKIKKEEKSIPVTKKQVIRVGNITIEFEKGTTKNAIIGLDGSITII
jgi:hypothetical protein